MERFLKSTVALLFVVSVLVITPVPGNCVPFEITYNYSEGFHIYGHQPVPQVNGFEYYFSPLGLNNTLIGEGVTITNISVSAPGTSSGAVINWDWEVFIGSSPFGLPSGQFTATNIDPVIGYVRTAPTQLQFVVGGPSATGNYTFSGSYDFLNGTITATPYLNGLKNASTTEMNLSDGLYAQLFFWTGDNRNCYISFDNVVLTVRGDIRNPIDPIPEPSTMLLLGSGLAGLVAVRRKLKK